MHVYIAGGTGAIGTRLIRQLVERGHRVTATTRDPAKRAGLERLGARAVIVDGLDSAAVGEAVATAEPDAVVHQMTALAAASSIRSTSTGRSRSPTVCAPRASTTWSPPRRLCGVRQIVAQSYTGWPNIRSGGWVKDEEDPLDPDPPKAQRESLAAIRYLEETVRKVDGTVLRYGGFYGDASDPMIAMVRKRQFPLVGGGTGYMSWVHLDDAASATVLALEEDARESSTSSTTSRLRPRSGCRTSPTASAPSHRCGCRCGWLGWPPARWRFRC